MLDELDFPIVSHATSQTGKPIYYRGETLQHHVGTYHPTLYINSLAGFIKVFGYNETSVRFFGVTCTLLSAGLLILILRQLIKRNDSAEAILLGMFLLNPYTIANTTLPDIDSTILPVLILLFVYFAVRLLLQKQDTSQKASWILGGLFGLALWSKLTTPLIIPPFLAALTVITTRDYKKSLLFTLKVTVIGIAGFVVSYFLYCKLLGLSPSYTYHFLLESFTKGTSTDGPLVGAINNLKSFRSFVYWLTIPIVGLIGISSIGVLLDKTKDEKTKIKKLLVITSLLVTFFYIALIAPFGGFFKYPFPVFGLLLLNIALFYDRYLKDAKVRWGYGIIAALIGFAIEKKLWGDSMFLTGKPFRGLIVLLVVVIGWYLLIRMEKKIAAQAFVLMIFFAIGFQFSISRAQAIAPYPTKYNYGQMGLDKATAYLKSNTEPDEAIWSMKDVGYYVNNRYYESYSYFFDKSLENDLVAKLKEGKVKYYVVSTGIGQDSIDYYKDIKQILDAHAVQEKQFDNFIIYRSKE